MTFTAKVHQGTILLPPGIDLPEGSQVEVHAQAEAETRKKSRKGLLQFAGSIEGAADFAAEHDHYIHGTPKRNGA